MVNTKQLAGLLPVTKGGTGVSSVTAYAVVCGGVTSTSALQAVAGVGTAGQFLTSNGAGLKPTWQTPANLAYTNVTNNFTQQQIITANSACALEIRSALSAAPFDYGEICWHHNDGTNPASDEWGLFFATVGAAPAYGQGDRNLHVYSYAQSGNVFIFGDNGNCRMSIENTQMLYPNSNSASLPQVTFFSDSNTGIYHPGAGIVGITCSGTQRARVTTTGILPGANNTYNLGDASNVWATTFSSNLRVSNIRDTSGIIRIEIAPTSDVFIYDYNSNYRLIIGLNGVQVGPTGAFGTADTTGFLKISYSNGVPTGVPLLGTGTITFNASSNTLYVYNSGWQAISGGGGITGSGTDGYVARWTGASSLSTGIIRDNGTEAGVGAAPQSTNALTVLRSTAVAAVTRGIQSDVSSTINIGTATSMYGVLSQMTQGSGTASGLELVGFRAFFQNSSASLSTTVGLEIGQASNGGTITNVYGVRIEGITAAGTYNTIYGVYIGDNTVSATKYSLYSAGSTTTLFHAGAATFSSSLSASTFSGNGASITNLAAGNIATGTVATARLGSGTANANTLLHGNSTWSAVSLTADVTGILGAANGGTGNGFTAFTGPTTSTKTFTLPDASATILTSNAAVTVAQGGSGRATATAYMVICGGTTSTGAHQSVATGTNGQALLYAGAAALPAYGALSLSTATSVTGILPAANGGTGNGFTAFTGPTTSTKTFTLPDASAVILTDNADVTVDQGGTGRSTATAYMVICGGTTNTAAHQSVATGTTGQALLYAGASALPAYGALSLSTATSVTGILGAANGGTGNGFTAFTGPTTSTKTFTLPDASALILTDNTDVTVDQGGTGRSTATAYAVLCGGTTSTAAHQSVATLGSAGHVLTSNGAGALPTWQAPVGTIDGSGAATRVTFWSDTDTITSDNLFAWDATNDRLGVGVAAPVYALDVATDSVTSIRGVNAVVTQVTALTTAALSGIMVTATSAAGTVTDLIGVNIASVTGGTNNYALYTNAGTVRLGGSVLLQGGTSNTYLQFDNGVSAAIGSVNTARLRYNDTTSKLQVSLDGNSYVDLVTEAGLGSDYDPVADPLFLALL